jgi:hypothetical protein
MLSTGGGATLRRALQWPLLHFVVLGVALYAGLRWHDDARVHVVPADVAAARLEFATLLGVERLSDAQLLEADQRFVTDELLFREALRRGLDREDPVIRQRLVQKLLFAEEELQLARREPSEEDLRRLYAQQFPGDASTVRVSFEHVYLPALDESQRRALAARIMSAPPGADGRALANGLAPSGFPLGGSFDRMEAARVVSIFGDGFASALERVPSGRWAGPFESKYGWHLVRVTGRSALELPEFTSVALRLREQWIERQRQAAREALVRGLAQREDLDVAGDGGTPVLRERLRMALTRLRGS